MNRWLRAVGDWFDARLKLRSTMLPMMRHPIPREVAGPMGWWYVFGSASLTLLLVQILTGIGLALVFVPSADKAYDSLLALNYDVTWAGSCGRCTTTPVRAWSCWCWCTRPRSSCTGPTSTRAS